VLSLVTLANGLKRLQSSNGKLFPPLPHGTVRAGVMVTFRQFLSKVYNRASKTDLDVMCSWVMLHNITQPAVVAIKRIFDDFDVHFTGRSPLNKVLKVLSQFDRLRNYVHFYWVRALLARTKSKATRTRIYLQHVGAARALGFPNCLFAIRESEANTIATFLSSLIGETWKSNTDLHAADRHVTLPELFLLLFQHFVPRPQLKQLLIWSTPSAPLSAVQMVEIQALFSRFDTNGDGVVTLQEFQQQHDNHFKEVAPGVDPVDMFNAFKDTNKYRGNNPDLTLLDYQSFYRELWNAKTSTSF